MRRAFAYFCHHFSVKNRPRPIEAPLLPNLTPEAPPAPCAQHVIHKQLTSTSTTKHQRCKTSRRCFSRLSPALSLPHSSPLSLASFRLLPPRSAGKAAKSVRFCA